MNYNVTAVVINREQDVIGEVKIIFCVEATNDFQASKYAENYLRDVLKLSFTDLTLEENEKGITDNIEMPA